MEPKTTLTNGLDEIANFTFTSKYARYSEKHKRRESWKEAITRVEEMHVEKYDFLSDEDKQVFTNGMAAMRENIIRNRATALDALKRDDKGLLEGTGLEKAFKSSRNAPNGL